jgi:hypothetical protein
MKIAKISLVIWCILCTRIAFGQTCNCETEFIHIKNFMEQNYAGFKDKEAEMTKAGYRKLVDDYRGYSKQPHADEQCLLLITQFLDHFKDNHVFVRSNFGNTIDSPFISRRQVFDISDQKYQELLHSRSTEGVYYFNWDSTAYKIAVIKDISPLHDYIAITLNSKLPGWKRGVLKFEGKMENDTVLKGVLFMRNQLPATQTFVFRGNTIFGDWQRVGTVREKTTGSYIPVASRKLSDKTLYIKISSFSPSNSKNIDSVLEVNKNALATMPYLVLDLRGNGGGADYTYVPLLRYLYTNPVHNIGVDVLATDANIKGWSNWLNDKDRSEENTRFIQGVITTMEANKGKMININDDQTTTMDKVLPYPAKVAILIDKGCASTTEQFLLWARQSKKVILVGDNTSGTLDYSNKIEAPFLCMPYILQHSSSRSRRLDVGQGIDNVGIPPDHRLTPNDDWIKAAVSVLEK